ncbi:MAG: 50S ribosomal protein L3 [Candidatus Tectomicrobia bacterium]|nr:50S ribosomal protein L3 [Candidatus Tectomicrobia bacterium]
MALGLIGKKLGMTHIFDSEGNPIPITLIAAGPCKVAQVKSVKRDGYRAVQLAFEVMREKRLSKPEGGHLRKAGIEPMRVLREFRLDASQQPEVAPGDTLDASLFKVGDLVDIIGTSKGRGFTGVIKRHGFSGTASNTHGSHEYFRHGGSIGGRFPQHVIKGVGMPGRYGGSRVTMQNLQVVDVRPAQNLLAVRGAVPGSRNGYVFIRPAKKGPAPTSTSGS